MQHLNWQRKPDLLAIINVLATASTLGFLYCIAALLYDNSAFSRTSLVIYAMWFVICLASLFLMKRGDNWGVYSLALATVFVGIYELGNGLASIGGAVLALSLLFVLLYYLLNIRQVEDDENERSHNPL